MTRSQQQFLELLRSGLWGKPADASIFQGEIDWQSIVRIAKEQTVQVLVANGIETLPKEGDYYCARLKISKKNAGVRGRAPFKLELYSWNGILWESEPNPVRTLGKYVLSPGCFGWIHYEDEIPYDYSHTPIAEKKK